MRGDEPRGRLRALGATLVLRRPPLTRSSTGEVAEAGVVGDLKKLSFGLMLSLVGGVIARGTFVGNGLPEAGMTTGSCVWPAFAADDVLPPAG